MDIFYEGLIKEIVLLRGSTERKTQGREDLSVPNSSTKQPKFLITGHPRLSVSSEDATLASYTFAVCAFCSSDRRQTFLGQGKAEREKIYSRPKLFKRKGTVHL